MPLAPRRTPGWSAMPASPKMAGGAFEATLSVPAGYKDGKYYIKVYADDGVADSYGSTAAP